MTVALVIIGVVLLLVLIFVGLYNSLVTSRNRVDNAWSQIDVQLKRRHGLIPNLVAAMQTGGSVAQTAANENMLTSALKSLFALSESYPDLKANQNFLALQEELTSTEDRISYSRQFYNDQVRSLNTKIQSIPTNIVAGIGGFTLREYFEIDEADKQNVEVKFDS